MNGHGTGHAEPGSAEGHGRWLALLSSRLDSPLSRDDEALLATHLAECGRCRSVQRAYDEEGRSLRNLGTVPPPRDLWARTSAALDRELAAGDGAGGGRVIRVRGDGPRSLLWLPLTTITVLGVAGVAAWAGPRLTSQGDSEAGGVPVRTVAEPLRQSSDAARGQELSVVDVLADGRVTLFRAAVASCPQPIRECVIDAVASPSPLRMDARQRLVDLTLHSGKRRLALLAENQRGADTLSVVVLPPSGSGNDPGAGPGPDGRWPPVMQPGRPSADVPGSPGGVGRPGRTGRSVPPTAIVDDVLVTGAPPAWSSDGEALAFSAMPVNGSRGADLYLWRVGDERATRLTSDHRTWFASWSGDRIVASRVSGRGGEVAARTIVIDPSTGRWREVALRDAWLPSVDPDGRYALSWRGELEGPARQPRTRSGELFLVDWAAVDPFQAQAPRDPDGQSIPSAIQTREGQAKTNASDAWLERVEPVRNTTLDPLLDWEVQWTSDGANFGYWVADVPASTWGELSVFQLDRNAGRIDRGSRILGPVLARRSFTLGHNRIAWVAPSEEEAPGELRVRTWGGPAPDTIRIRGVEIRTGIPAF
jgi:hypothetical protein